MVKEFPKVQFIGTIKKTGNTKLIRVSKVASVYGLEVGKAYKITIEELDQDE